MSSLIVMEVFAAQPHDRHQPIAARLFKADKDAKPVHAGDAGLKRGTNSLRQEGSNIAVCCFALSCHAAPLCRSDSLSDLLQLLGARLFQTIFAKA